MYSNFDSCILLQIILTQYVTVQYCQSLLMYESSKLLSYFVLVSRQKIKCSLNNCNVINIYIFDILAFKKDENKRVMKLLWKQYIYIKPPLVLYQLSDK